SPTGTEPFTLLKTPRCHGNLSLGSVDARHVMPSPSSRTPYATTEPCRQLVVGSRTSGQFGHATQRVGERIELALHIGLGHCQFQLEQLIITMAFQPGQHSP